MHINKQNITKICPEVEIFEPLLSLDNKHILELGCGDATLTRLIASTGKGRQVLATEVDQRQHEKNLLIDDLPQVNFVYAGAQEIPAEDKSMDIVFMFKSLHHVPAALMPQAFHEISRVLKPHGLAYISEPVFSGDFNNVLRLFHDEQKIRQAAFNAVKKVVDDGLFTLEDEIFFKMPLNFENFAQFEAKVIGATHSEHQLSAGLLSQVEEKFNHEFAHNQGNFLIPIRIDLLKVAQ